MKVGYIGGLSLRGSNGGSSEWVQTLVSESVSQSLDFLVLSGGISSNYHTTLSFIDELGRQLKDSDIKLRFIIGNTDLYYPQGEASPDKQVKFNEIISRYRASQFYLPGNPILTRNTRILGAETWYDYSLYRGNPKNLRDITRKQLLFRKHPDGIYITDKDDYTLGVKNTFDVSYCNQCHESLNSALRSQYSKHGESQNLVVVTYFKGSKALLHDGYFARYFGAFEGSLKLGEILSAHHVTQNIYGSESDKDRVKMNGVTYINSNKSNPTGKMRIIEYA